MNNVSDHVRLEDLSREWYEVLCNEMARYSCMDSLVHLKRFITSMRAQGKGSLFEFRGQQMGFHVFPFFADLIIRYSPTVMATNTFSDDTIAWLTNKVLDFPEMMYLPTGKANLNKYAPEALMRMAFNQLPIQEMNRTLIPRILFLYKDIPESNAVRHRKFIQAREEVLSNQFRVNLDDVLLCTFALGAIGNCADRFNDILSTEVEWMKPHVESDAMPIVRSQLSLTREAYIRRANEQFSGRYTFINTAPVILNHYPIIDFGDWSVTPDPHLLLNRVTRYFRDSVYQYFDDNNRLQEYAGTFGEIFKDYIGLILKECYGVSNVIDLDEADYLVGRKADWLVVSGGSAAIYECKCLNYPKALKTSGSLDILEPFVSEKIQGAYEQILQTESQWPLLIEKIPSLENTHSVHKFIVLEEHFQYANAMIDFLPDNPTLKGIVRDEVLFLSTLDLETIICSNLRSDFDSVYGDWLTNIKLTPTLEQYVRKLDGFEFDADNFLDKAFADFFHKHEQN